MGKRLRMARALLTVLLAPLVLLAAALPASATSAGCAFDAGTVTVSLSSPGQTVLRTSAGEITVDGAPCGGATVLAAEQVSIVDATDGASDVVIDLSGGALGPGLTDEPGASDEIEIDVDLGAGLDRLTILGGSGSDAMSASGSGINMNAAESDGVDEDVRTTSVEMTAFSGGSGADRFSNGPGADSFAGGTGFDTVDYSSFIGPVTVTIGDGAANDGRAGEGDEVAGDVEHVVGSAADDRITGDGTAELLEGGGGSDLLTGASGDDELRGDGGDDVLRGGGNDDHLIGGTGNDEERGEDGNDAFSPSVQQHADSYPSRTIADRSTTVATMEVSGVGAPVWDVNVRIDVEHPSTQQLSISLVAPTGTRTLLSRNRGNGTPFQGTVFDSEEATTINKAGSKTFAGRFHPEGSLEPFRGQNPNGTWRLEITDNATGSVGTLNMWRLQFSPQTSSHDGDDVVSGGSGTRDIVDWAGRAASLDVSLAGGADDGQAGEVDNIGAGLADIEECYGGNGNDIITGTAAVNDLRGQIGADRVSGLGGNDQMRGGQGADFMSGGDGNDSIEGGALDDSIDGGAGFDFSTYGRASGAVTVDLAAGTSSGAEGGDTLSSVENVAGSRFGDTLRGSALANVIQGGSGNDSTFGLGGNDRLDGQVGTDSADGGAGTDTCLNAENRVSCEG